MAKSGGGRKYSEYGHSEFGFLQPSREMGADAEEEESHCNTLDGDVTKFSV